MLLVELVIEKKNKTVLIICLFKFVITTSHSQNGVLFQAREGFIDLTGVDYSQNAIDLAESVMKTQNMTIRYEMCDILSADCPVMSREYAVALDKGTYDAVSLHPLDPKGKREKYISNVWKLLKPQGLLLITSCNWTEKELISHFSSSEFYF